LGVVCDLKDVIWLALLTVLQRRADPGIAAVMPGCLNQQTARQRRAGLGDRSSAG
jgi:hypothetical protein